MNILLTGSTGFIGKYFSQNYEVYRHVVRRKDNHNYINPFIVDNINSQTNWVDAFDQVDVVVHLAGLAHSDKYLDSDYDMINVNGTCHLARSAAEAGVKRFVFVSSIGVNGTSTNGLPFSVESAVCPHNAYSQSKLNAELGLKKIAQETGLEIVIVRPVLVYGPGAPGNFGLLTSLVKKCPILPFGLAKNRRSFVSVQNLSSLLFTCANHPDASGNTFFACDKTSVSTKHFTNSIADGLGKKIIQLPIPINLMRFMGKIIGKSAMIEQLYGDLEVDSSNTKEILGWEPPLTMKQSMALLSELDY